MSGATLDLRAVTDGKSAGASGVDHAEVLVAFAEAVVGRDDAALGGARRALLDAMGGEALVDAAAVVANFQRMVRIADGTGIPLDAPLDVMSADLREELELSRFGSSVNTPISAVRGALGRAARPLARQLLRWVGRARRGAVPR